MHKPPLVIEQKAKKEIIKATHHETLQRIECETDEFNYYQQHWFSSSLEVGNYLVFFIDKTYKGLK